MNMQIGDVMAIEGGIPIKTSCMRTGNHVKESLESWTRQNIGENRRNYEFRGEKCHFYPHLVMKINTGVNM